MKLAQLFEQNQSTYYMLYIKANMKDAQYADYEVEDEIKGLVKYDGGVVEYSRTSSNEVEIEAIFKNEHQAKRTASFLRKHKKKTGVYELTIEEYIDGKLGKTKFILD